MEHQINLHIQLLKPDGNPLNGMSIHIKVYDKDVISDDYLGSIIPDQDGKGVVTFKRSDFQSFDSFSEQYPDIYFVVFRGDDEIFRSQTFNDLKVEEHESGENGIHFNLGSFVVPV